MSVETAIPAAVAGEPCAADKDRLSVLTLAVENMHCGGCLSAVEKAAAGVAGVANARASLSARRITVHYDPRRACEEDLIGALDGAGFRAAIMDSVPAGGESNRDKEFLKRVAVAGFAAANIMLLSVSVWSVLQAIWTRSHKPSSTGFPR